MSVSRAVDALSGMGLLPGNDEVLLVDLASYRPPDELRMVMSELKNVGRNWKLYMPETERFATKVLEKSGLSSNGTYLPPAVHPCHTKDPDYGHGTAHYEAEMVMTGAVRDLLDRTGTKPQDVDILITCASIWCATPSQASMLVNHFGFRDDIQSYHLGGMGCATGVLLMSLVKDMLRAHPNSRLLFVASETTTYAFYPGMELSRRVSNVIFRMGGTAVLFSNKRADAGRAKYRLQHHVRFHTSADDDAYRCISWSPDEEGHLGVYLGKDVVDQAGKALTLALTSISPKIMSWGQLAEAAANMVHRKVVSMPAAAALLGLERCAVKPYQPDFGKCVDYFLIHAGGYAVLRGIQSGMRLPASAMLPSFAALRDYGNTSASTTWYSFSYLETCVGLKQGQRLMQIGCGGGMKCAIAIWQCLRDVRENHKAWRHLASPLTEADLPRQISEATKLSAALKSGMAAAPAGDKEAPAVIATITERPAIAGDKVGGKPAAAAVVDASEGLQQQVTPVVSLQCDSDVSSTAATVSSSAGSDSDDYDSSNGGNALKSVSSVDSDAAARPHPNFSEVSSSAVVGGGSSGSPADQAAAGEQVHTGSELAPHVAQFNDDPDEYEFHL